MNLIIIEPSELQQLIEAAVVKAITKIPLVEPKDGRTVVEYKGSR